MSNILWKWLTRNFWGIVFTMTHITVFTVFNHLVLPLSLLQTVHCNANWQRSQLKCNVTSCYWPMQLAPIERLGLEGDCCTIACLGAVDVDLSAQLHPGHSENGAGIGRWQSERVLFTMLQQVQITWETPTPTHTVDSRTLQNLTFN